MSQQQTATQAKEVVLRSYVPKDTPENLYRALRGYHYVLVGMFFFGLWFEFCALSARNFLK